MSPELQNKLFEKYPEIFAGKDLPITENLMAFGFECGNGWYDLIDEMCSEISWYLKEAKRQHAWTITRNKLTRAAKADNYEEYKRLLNSSYEEERIREMFNNYKDLEDVPETDEEFDMFFIAEQVKEKYGGLRFYYSGGNEYISGIVHFAESLSYKICESCGSNQDVFQTGGWVTTICKKCSENK